VTGMEIYRLGTRMMMVMETDDAVFDAAAMAAATTPIHGCVRGKN
jgi:L-rhamnose mutarotase